MSVTLRQITFFVSWVTILLSLCMTIPVWVALAAGLASLSLLIFSVTTIVLAVLIYIGKIRSPIVLGALFMSLLCLATPQIAFVKLAEKEQVQLSFNPISYVHFSGATTIKPTKTLHYTSGSGNQQAIAYFRSDSAKNRPAVLMLHGGGWRYGSHLEVGNWPKLLTSAGFDVFSIEYALSSDNNPTWKEAPNDVHQAILYLKAHARSFDIDPDQLTLLGQSAGGHLALLEAYKYQDVDAVIGLYAPVDPALDYSTSRDKSSELDFIGGPPSQYPDRYRIISPLTYVSNTSPKTLLLQGNSDDLVSIDSSRALMRRLANVGVERRLVILPLTGHSFENQRGGFATQIAEQSVINFLKN